MKLQVIAVLAALTLTGVMPDAASATDLEKADVPGISNFTRFDGSPAFAGSPAAFGGATQASAMPWLKSEGFATVIDLRLTTEAGVDIGGSRAAAEAAGLSYIHLPFNPGNPGETEAVVFRFLTVAANEANQPVYIHCQSATRAAALWMIGRVLEDGKAVDVAAKEAEAIAAKPEDAVAIAAQYIKLHGN